MRMFLIPEELFVELNASKASTAAANPDEGSAIGLVRSRLAQAGTDRSLNPDARAIRYEQEFKRYNKLLRDAEERPLDVKLHNVEEVVERLHNQQQQQQHDEGKKEQLTPLRPPIPKSGKRTEKILTKHAKKRGTAAAMIVTTRKKKKRLNKNATGSENDDDDFHSTSGEQQPTTSVATSHKGGKQEGEQAEAKQRAMAYIRRHAKELGIDGDHIQKWTGTQWSAIPGSSVEKIVEHMLTNAGKRTRAVGTGYAEFTKRLTSHPILREILIPSSSPSQSGRGLITKMKIHKKPTNNFSYSNLPFKFKPTLWHHLT